MGRFAVRLRAAGVAAAALSVATSAFAQQTADPRWGDGGVSAFYTPKGALGDRPGRLLNSEPLPAKLVLPEAASGQRILYTATDGVAGKGIVAVSGAYFTPKGAPPEGGWPLIAWAHGTVGMADVCAPSWAGRIDRDVKYLDTWLSNGFAVVATDYQGLGTPGPHAYIETRPEAYSVLDSVRAVLGADKRLSGKVIIVGQSQGAGAAFATAALAGAYAPELNIRGTVATGTPNISARTLATASNTDLDRVDPTIAYVFYLTQTAQAERPSVDPSKVLTDKALPLYERSRTMCIGPLFEAVSQAGLTRRTSVKPEGQVGVFGPLLGSLGYATLKLNAPIFMGAGAADKDVNPAQQMQLAKDACAAGSVVEAHLYEGLNHSGTVNGSLPDSLPFVRKALAGEPITPRCDAAPERRGRHTGMPISALALVAGALVGGPTPGRPVWIKGPSPVEAKAALQGTKGADMTGRAILNCVVTDTGMLSRCSVVSETPTGAGFGGAALKLSGYFQMATKSSAGLATAGGSVLVPIIFRP